MQHGRRLLEKSQAKKTGIDQAIILVRAGHVWAEADKVYCVVGMSLT